MKSFLFGAMFTTLILSGSTCGLSETQTDAIGVPTDPAALGYLNLKKRHPDADEGPVEFNRLYSSDLALQRLKQIVGFLESFRKLTDLARPKLTPRQLSTVGNTDDVQTIGFRNIPLIVEGTILKQQYQLSQAEFELAQLQRAAGNISAAQLDHKRQQYAKATKTLQAFWDTRLPTD